MNLPEHLARHRLADLFLDTLPHNAHTTASDALWAGLPILTCLGTTFPGRVAASLLNAIGMSELITHSLTDYESLAVRLAHEPDTLKRLKTKLAQNRVKYPLFDTKRFAHHIEAAYTTMWERHQRGEPPSAFPLRRFRVTDPFERMSAIWHKADIPSCTAHVRFRGKSGNRAGVRMPDFGPGTTEI